jgi:hypothetical protein
MSIPCNASRRQLAIMLELKMSIVGRAASVHGALQCRHVDGLELELPQACMNALASPGYLHARAESETSALHAHAHSRVAGSWAYRRLRRFASCHGGCMPRRSTARYGNTKSVYTYVAFRHALHGTWPQPIFIQLGPVSCAEQLLSFDLMVMHARFSHLTFIH